MLKLFLSTLTSCVTHSFRRGGQRKRGREGREGRRKGGRTSSLFSCHGDQPCLSIAAFSAGVRLRDWANKVMAGRKIAITRTAIKTCSGRRPARRRARLQTRSTDLPTCKQRQAYKHVGCTRGAWMHKGGTRAARMHKGCTRDAVQARRMNKGTSMHKRCTREAFLFTQTRATHRDCIAVCCRLTDLPSRNTRAPRHHWAPAFPVPGGGHRCREIVWPRAVSPPDDGRLPTRTPTQHRRATPNTICLRYPPVMMVRSPNSLVHSCSATTTRRVSALACPGHLRLNRLSEGASPVLAGDLRSGVLATSLRKKTCPVAGGAQAWRTQDTAARLAPPSCASRQGKETENDLDLSEVTWSI